MTTCSRATASLLPDFARLRARGDSSERVVALRYPSAELWPSPSRNSPTRAPHSGAPSTRWRRRSTTRARSATAPAARIGSARSAARTPAARSSRRPRRTTTTTTEDGRRMPARRIRALINRADGDPLPVKPVHVPGHRRRRQRRRPRSRPRSPRARTSPPPRASASCLFGPAAELGNAGPGIEVIDAPLSIAKERQPGRRRARQPRVLDRARRPRRRRRRRRRARLRRLDRRRARRRAVQHQARPRHPAPGARRPDPGARHAGDARRRRREHRGARRAPRPVRVHGRRARAGRARRRATRASRCCRSARRRRAARR